jgi:hypothetical protein
MFGRGSEVRTVNVRAVRHGLPAVVKPMTDRWSKRCKGRKRRKGRKGRKRRERREGCVVGGLMNGGFGLAGSIETNGGFVCSTENDYWGQMY